MASPSGRTRRAIQFTAPGEVHVVEEDLAPPGPDDVLVETAVSAVSPGTETLIYRGDAPAGAVDPSIEALDGEMAFPVTYGYCAVGRVVETGSNIASEWLGRRVFSFQPHVSAFVARPADLIPLPSTSRDRDAVLIPNLETAVNFVMDGRPMIGEDVVIFGQGVVGLLTTALLSRFPVSSVLTVEPEEKRRERSETLGAHASFNAEDDLTDLRSVLDIEGIDATPAEDGRYEGADLVYELSGQPAALDDALSITGFDGRIVVGSWYGTKRAPINLGERYHRSRISIRSSQVSTVDPDLQGRWTKTRRMETVLRLLDSVRPGQLVSDVVPVDEAPAVYERLAAGDPDLLQPVFRYNDSAEGD
jgi:2-desacetyl-2-hydroxyethyl bacteriochlorophyllide A dehydrogenase